MTTTASVAVLGRRDRAKREKRDRILRAAGDLFSRQGYAATTTAQIAEAADVAHGTLFRYATTKAELLLMVGNERIAGILEGRLGARPSSANPGAGPTGASPTAVLPSTPTSPSSPAGDARTADPVDALLAILSPIAVDAIDVANLAAYQRFVLDGRGGQAHRDAAVALLETLERRIADLLEAHWLVVHARRASSAGTGESAAPLVAPSAPSAPSALGAARAVYACLHVQILHAERTGDDAAAFLDGLREQCDVIARGYLATPPNPARGRSNGRASAPHEGRSA